MAAGDPFLRSPFRTAEKVRETTVHPPSAVSSLAAARPGVELADDDQILTDVRQALSDGFGGVIFSGPPGTSKSWYAERIARKLAGDDSRVRMTQFHPSYQYEDFIEGYVPDGGGFAPKPKHLLQICIDAQRSLDAGESHTFVLVIDELSRSDPARVFGEALTYVEQSKRGQAFHIASGRKMSIPKNVVILATMNTFDRGVDEVDAAFDRRMAKIEMDPDPALAEQFLISGGMDPILRSKVLNFFRWLQHLPEKHAHLGHTFFMGVTSEADLERRWRFQLVHVLKKAYRLNDDGFKKVQDAWLKVLEAPAEIREIEATPYAGGEARAAESPETYGPGQPG